VSRSRAFDAAHPRHPYHEADQELYQSEPAESMPPLSKNGSLKQEMILVESYRDQGNSMGVVNQVIVEDSQEDAYTGHTGRTPGTHRSSQMCSPGGPGKADMRAINEFIMRNPDGDFNPLLSELRSDMVRSEARLVESSNSRHAGRNLGASMNE